MAEYRYPGKDKPISDKMYRVVVEYFDNSFNKRQAMLSAGYSLQTCDHQTAQVFEHPAVKKEIARRHAEKDKTSKIDREWIVSRLMALADGYEKLNQFVKVAEDGSLYWDFKGATEKELKYIRGLSLDFYTDGKGDFARTVKKFKIDTTDPLAVLNTLARIEGLFADRLKLEGDDGVIEALQAGRRRANIPDD